MRKVIASVFVSLDGIMQAPGGPDEDPAGGFAFGGWVFPLWDETLGEAMSALFESPFDLLLGRRTYDIFAAYWPHQDDPIAERFNAVTKFVATSSEEPLAWHGSVALRGDVPGEIGRLKQQDGPNLLVQGSSVLLHSLFAERLVDELTLLTFPVVLGAGKKLFDEGSAPATLKLVDSRTSSKDVIIARYVPAGEVRTGSFADPEAGEARRERGKTEEPA
jgi:dihydrofolate reductase